MLGALLKLVGSLTSTPKPTKNELYNIIVDWNENIAIYRNYFLNGLERLPEKLETSDSNELSEKLSKMRKLSQNIVTYFQEHLSGKIFVKNGKTTKKLYKISTSFS